MQSTHTLICLAAGAGIAIAGAHVRQAIERSREVDSQEQSMCFTEPTYTMDQLIDAIQAVETGGHADPAHAWGDGGKSYGWLQISYACWADATDVDDEPRCPAHEADWQADASSRTDARLVALDYWRRYCPTAITHMDCETLARVWNGGPKGAEKESTLAYWAKVLAALEARP